MFFWKSQNPSPSEQTQFTSKTQSSLCQSLLDIATVCHLPVSVRVGKEWQGEESGH